LQGSVRIDPFTEREVITLAGDEDRTIDITWPEFDKADPGARVEAVVKADESGKMPPKLVARLLMQALGVEDVDELLAEMLDADGNWVDPARAQALADAEQAAAGALAAVQAGDFPTDQQAQP
jgi:hypothetical protein